MRARESSKRKLGGSRKLTPAQEKFAQAVARGDTQSDAYRAAYPRSLKWMPKSVHEQASEVAHIPKVAARIAEIRAPARDAVRITQEERIKTYLDIAKRAAEANDLQAETRAQDSVTKVAGLFTAERQNNRSPVEDLAPAQRDAVRAVIDAALAAAERDAADERSDA